MSAAVGPLDAPDAFSKLDGIPVDLAVARWQASVVYDGSVGSHGFEINTAPASGAYWVEQVRALCQALQQQHAIADDRCGCHIHVDARDFSYYEIKKLILLYAAIELALFEMVPLKRRGSRFCVPCSGGLVKHLDDRHNGKPLPDRLGYYINEYRVRKQIKERKYHQPPKDTPYFVEQHVTREENNTQQLKRNIMMAIYGHCDGRLVREAKKDKRGEQRYRALNLHSWFYRRTIEWRLPEGTVDPETIINWGVLMAAILDVVNQSSEKEIRALIHSRFRSSVAVLEHIAPTRAVKEWITARTRRFACA